MCCGERRWNHAAYIYPYVHVDISYRMCVVGKGGGIMPVILAKWPKLTLSVCRYFRQGVSFFFFS